MYTPNSKWTWSFLIVTLLQGIIGLAMEGYVFGLFQKELLPEAYNRVARGNGNDSRAIPTYLALLIFGFLYENLLVYDALRSQNTIQVIGLCIYNLGLLVYTAIQIDQVKGAVRNLNDSAFISMSYWDEVKGYLIAVPCVVALGTALMTFLAWKLYGEFGWNIYKQIGADLRMKKRFLLYQIYIAILKFDFFLFLGFEIQFLVLVAGTKDSERYLTIAAIPVTILVLLFAAWSTQRENIVGMICTMIVYFAMVAYFIFKLARMYTVDGQRKYDYDVAKRTLTVFAVFTLIFIAITIVLACMCMYNFNKGLKVHLVKPRPGSSEEPHTKEPGYDLEYNHPTTNFGANSRPYGGSRMEID